MLWVLAFFLHLDVCRRKPASVLTKLYVIKLEYFYTLTNHHDVHCDSLDKHYQAYSSSDLSPDLEMFWPVSRKSYVISFIFARKGWIPVFGANMKAKLWRVCFWEEQTTVKMSRILLSLWAGTKFITNCVSVPHF